MVAHPDISLCVTALLPWAHVFCLVYPRLSDMYIEPTCHNVLIVNPLIAVLISKYHNSYFLILEQKNDPSLWPLLNSPGMCLLREACLMPKYRHMYCFIVVLSWRMPASITRGCCGQFIIDMRLAGSYYQAQMWGKHHHRTVCPTEIAVTVL